MAPPAASLAVSRHAEQKSTRMTRRLGQAMLERVAEDGVHWQASQEIAAVQSQRPLQEVGAPDDYIVI
jgi:hypothetical protein